jgi:hypothetical protein
MLIVITTWSALCILGYRKESPQTVYRFFLLRNLVFFAVILPELVVKHNDLRNERHLSRTQALLVMAPNYIFMFLLPTLNMNEIGRLLTDRSFRENIHWLSIWND